MVAFTELITARMATRPCSVAELLAQIGPGVLMSIGARQVVDLGDGVQMAVSRGGRKLVIKLAANDTYTIERVRLIRGTSVISEACTQDVYAEDLPAIVRRLGDV